MQMKMIRILADEVADELDASGPVPVGTEVLANIAGEGEYIMEPGEAWYIRPDTGEDWLSLPGDYEIIEEEA